MSRHMKEEDDLIAMIRMFIIGFSEVPMSVREAFAAAQTLLDDHRLNSAHSKLKKYCPNIGKVYVPLDLVTALDEYDTGSHITKRRFVAPTFREVREILNLACVHAVASSLQLLTLDADDTIYSDGGTLSVDSPIIPLVCKLLRMGVHVALVTAAAYPGEPHKMEVRISGLLRSLAFAIECGAPPDIVSRFHVMCGECNYLLETRVESGGEDGLSPRVFLEELPGSAWKNGRGVRWDHGEVQRLLDAAEASLRESAELLGLDVLVIRKLRAVGIIARPAAAVSAPAAVAPMSKSAHIHSARAPTPSTSTSASASPSSSIVGSCTAFPSSAVVGSCAAGSCTVNGTTAAAAAVPAPIGSKPHISTPPAPAVVAPLPCPAPYGGTAHRLCYEVLEEVALAVQRSLTDKGFTIPHCAFNGGKDVFIDIGHKALGIKALQARIGAASAATVHFGDRFTRTGNDLRARDVANTLWVTGPAETEYLLTLLIADCRAKRRAQAAIATKAATTAAAAATSPAAAAAAVAPHIVLPASASPAVCEPLPPLMSGGGWGETALPVLAPPGDLNHDEEADASSLRSISRLTIPPSVSVSSLTGWGVAGSSGLGVGSVAPSPVITTAAAAAALSSAPSSGDVSPFRGIGSSDDVALPQVYGVTAARALRDNDNAVASALRSDWLSAGGVVVGAVRPAGPSPRGSGASSTVGGSGAPSSFLAESPTHAPAATAVVSGDGDGVTADRVPSPPHLPAAAGFPAGTSGSSAVGSSFSAFPRHRDAE